MSQFSAVERIFNIIQSQKNTIKKASKTRTYHKIQTQADISARTKQLPRFVSVCFDVSLQQLAWPKLSYLLLFIAFGILSLAELS